VRQITLAGGSTSSEEVVFAPSDRKMQTLDAFLGLVDVMVDHPLGAVSATQAKRVAGRTAG